MNLTPLENLEVIIPDPGLREFGGHHPASILSIASYLTGSKTASLTVFCNKDISQCCIDAIHEQDVKVVPFFQTDFYVDFYKSPNYATSQHYIRQLSIEYYDFFCSLKNEKSHTLILFHTLNWQHASALSLVIQRFFNSNIPIPKIIIFLMYNPVKYNSHGDLDLTRQLNFLIGFKPLLNCKEVSLFASDHEVSAEFNKLLGEQIELHPCFLTGLTNSETHHLKNNKNGIILYAGDAKSNKGFLSLPRLLKAVAGNKKFEGYNFIIQYTLTNENPDLKRTEQELIELSNKKNNVILNNSFMCREELNQLFINSVAIVFNYDANVYQNQSSGLLWLAALFNVNIVLVENNWLIRESKRLGIHIKTATLDTIDEDLTDLLESKRLYVRTKYAEYIFQDFAKWLTHKVTSGEKYE